MLNSDFGFDDDGQPVPITEPEVCSQEDEQQESAPRDTDEAMINLFRILSRINSPLLTGKIVHLIAIKLGCHEDCETAAQYADRLRVSQAHISAISREFPKELAPIGKLKSRTKRKVG